MHWRLCKFPATLPTCANHLKKTCQNGKGALNDNYNDRLGIDSCVLQTIANSSHLLLDAVDRS